MPLLGYDPWETVYVREDPHEATSIMPVPGGLLVRVSWWDGSHLAMTMNHLPCSRDEFYEFQAAARR